VNESHKFLNYLDSEVPFNIKSVLKNGIDIGYGGRGSTPILDFLGYDKDTRGFAPSHMPFKNESFECVFSSHCLEHIDDYKLSISEWFRILKTRGHLVLILPHKFLYEKKECIPSVYNKDHKRFYTPASLMREVEESLEPNSYRVRCLMDFDYKFDYSLGRELHSKGNYSIVLVLEKIVKPAWGIE
jgi:SAM-dependent methyltransferase